MSLPWTRQVRISRRLSYLRALLALGLGVVAEPGSLPASAQEPATRAEQPAQEKTANTSLPLPKGKKLILTDGGFHIVRSYEVRGDRVRYYSLERSAWEEIPSDLVDWKATESAEAEAAQRIRETEKRIQTIKTEAVAQELEVDTSIEVAPGVFLPDAEGIYVVDGSRVVPLTSVSADVKRDKGRLLAQILVPVPVVPTLHRVEVPGKRAETRFSNPSPEFYIRIWDDREPEFELIRAKVKGDAREIQRISTNIAGDQYADQNSISVQKWRMARRLYRLTLSQSLEPGEYALTEILPDGMNLYVWDFGIDRPAALPPEANPKRAPSGKP